MEKENKNMPVTDDHLTEVVSKAVDESVEKAFRKYGGGKKRHHIVRNIIILVVLIAAIALGFQVYRSWQINHRQVDPVENHDMTFENHGIFGFKVADFAEPILGEASKEESLIVDKQQISVNFTITAAGFMKWAVFNKQQAVTLYGTGIYTVDLSDISENDIYLDKDRKEVTIKVPHPVLEETVFDPDQTEISDPENGWLAFGKIKLTADQTKEFESYAKNLLENRLKQEDCYDQADKYAMLSLQDLYEPIIEQVSPKYKVKIEFKDDLDQRAYGSDASGDFSVNGK